MLPVGRRLVVESRDGAVGVRDERTPFGPGAPTTHGIVGPGHQASRAAISRRASLSASIQGGAAPASRRIRWAIAHSPAALSSSIGMRSPR